MNKIHVSERERADISGKRESVYSALIWDFDGTLFNTYPAMAKALSRALEKMGHQLPAPEAHRLLKVSLRHAVEVSRNLFGPIEKVELEQRFLEERRAVEEPLSQPFPGAKEVCEHMRATGGRNFIYTHKEKTVVERLLHRFGMEKLFSDIVGGDDGHPHKPSPHGFLYLVKQHNLSPSATLTVGDRPLDITAAHAAGLAAVQLVEEGSQVAEDADYHIRQLIELIPLV